MSKLTQARVVSKRQVADAIVEIEFVGDRSPLPTWEPGAHTDVHLPNGLIRQYSLMQGESDPNAWRIAVLREDHGRGGSEYLADKLAVGQFVSLGEPRNHFHFDANAPLCFIGGGIGVTPLIPMAEAAERAGADWELHYLGRSRSHLAYVDYLVERFGSKIVLHIADESTRLDLLELLAERTPDTEVYCCGPERLLDALEQGMGESELLHLERFAPKDQEFAPNRAFTVVAEKSGVEFEVPEDESILVAADFEGIEIEGDCLEGTCGSCETRVISGEVEHRDSILTAKQRRENQCMMICVSRAAGDRIVLDI